MPRVLTLDNIVEAAYTMYFRSQLGINVCHYRVANVTASPTDQDAANALDAIAAPLYQQLLPQAVTYHGVRLRVAKVLPAPMAVTTSLLAGPGTIASDVMSLQTCGMVTKRTVLAGRAYRGRMYIPFPPETRNDPTGVPSAAYVADLATLATAICLSVTPVAGGGGTCDLIPVLYHRGTASSTDLSTIVARRKWATQRRRSDYGKPNLIPPW